MVEAAGTQIDAGERTAAENENKALLTVERKKSPFRDKSGNFKGRAAIEHDLEDQIDANLARVFGEDDDEPAGDEQEEGEQQPAGPAKGKRRVQFDADDTSKEARSDRRKQLEESTRVGKEGKALEAGEDKGALERTPEQKKVLAKALTALRFEKYTDQDLDGMSDEQILRLGTPMAERQAAESQRRESETQARNGNATAARTGSPADKQQGQPAAPAEDDEVSQAVKGFLDVAGEEYAEPFQKVVKSLEKKFSARVEAAESDLETLLDTTARASLRERFPQLDDPKHENDLNELMHDMAKSGRYGRADYPRLMRDAAWVLFGESVAAQAGARRATVREARRQGGPIVSTREHAPKARTLESRLDAAFDSVDKGASYEEGRRAFTG